ncbi:hypothetical protein [Maribacter sp. 2304DJ31-5]|uniref:hypothetical protein n=1 Tax=Maribacter sp. 2304DJ31-5 TaxID=3386273 RepID=UPI0039BD140A
MDFNEEENKKEEKKEIGEKNFLFYSWVNDFRLSEHQKSSLAATYIANYTFAYLEVSIPPPEYMG